jgi:hypothetical protein
MSYNYGPNYISRIQALQSGGLEGASALKKARVSRGLAGRGIDTQKVSDSEVESAQKKLLKRFSDVREENQSAKSELASLIQGLEEKDINVDPVTSKIEPPAEDVSNLKVSEKPMQTAFKLIDDLKSNYDMTTEQAAGFVGNLWHETGGFKFMQELKPTIKGSKGGLAFAQWTGPRRTQFENLLEELGDLPADSYEGNWAMISEELDTTERGALNKILEATTVEDAATTTSKFYLRPGKPMLDKRIQDANTIYNAYLESRQGSEE